MSIVRSCSSESVPEVVSLLERVWKAPKGAGPITDPMLHTLLHTGARVGAIAQRGLIMGAAITFLRSDDPHVAHMHVVGVAPEAQGQGLGLALIEDARVWALHAGVQRMQWTYDPLVRGLARLYLGVLGAHVISYRHALYGVMEDALNGGATSARLVVECPADRECLPPSTATEFDHLPAMINASGRLVALDHPDGMGIAHLPPDIVSLRHARPDLANEWSALIRRLLARPETEVLGVTSGGHYALRVTPHR